jgi:3-oxoadipate enol-lactonase
MPFVRTNGALLHYRVSGPMGAPALAFVNSLGTDSRIWDAVTELLNARYRVLCYDKRGHGLSDAPPGDYALDDHLDDLTALVDYVGLGRFGLVGVSIGGLIGQGLALRAPGRLSGLVLCNTAPKVGDAAMWNTRIDTVLARGTTAIADAVMERWFSETFRRERPDELAGWRNLFVRTDAKGYAATCATLRDTDLSAAITAIGVPTLVVAGSEDQSTPVALVRDCASRIRGARLKILNSGHIPSIEQPDALAALIDAFFMEVGRG